MGKLYDLKLGFDFLIPKVHVGLKRAIVTSLFLFFFLFPFQNNPDEYIIKSSGHNLYAISVSSDLDIVNLEISSSSPHNNDLVKVTVSVRNNGSSIVENFKVDLFKNYSSAPPSDKRGDLSYFVRRLSPGQVLPIDFVYRVYSGSYNAFAVIDPDKQINESNEGNNVSVPLAFNVGGNRTDDSFEDNDNTTQAKNFPSNNQAFSLVSKDKDYFKLNASPGSFIDISIQFEHAVSNLDLFLLDANGKIISASESYSNKESIFYKVPNEGIARVFYIYVKKGLNGNSYLLNIKTGQLNELSVAITSAVVTSVIQESSEDGSENYYRYGVTVTVKVTNSGAPMQNSVYVDLFRNESMKPRIGEFGNLDPVILFPSSFHYAGNGNQEATILFKDDSFVEGVYPIYAMVDSDNLSTESDESNNISASFRLVAGNGVAQDDNREQNDVHPSEYNGGARDAYVNNIKINQGVLFNQTALNDDYFAIELQSGEIMRLAVNFIHEQGDLDLYLHSLESSNIPLMRSETLENQEVIIFKNVTQTPKIYIAQVFPKDVNPKYNVNLSIYKNPVDTDLVVTDVKRHPLFSDRLLVTVSNGGSVKAENVRVDLFAVADNGAPPVLGEASYRFVEIPLLHGAESREIEVDWNYYSGTPNIYAIVDTYLTVLEVNEGNNIYGPERIISNNPQIEDDSFEISNNIENDSGENARRVGFSKYEGLKALDEDWYVISLGAGKSLQGTILFEEELGELDLYIYSHRVAGGKVYFDLISGGLPIENGGVIQYYNSNSSAQDIYIQILPATGDNGYTLNLLEETGAPIQSSPDLVISSVVTLPLNPTEGDYLRTTVAVKNIGKVTTVSDCYLDFFLGLKESPRPGKIGDLYEIIPAGLAPQDTVYFTFEYTLPRGNHKLYTSVDLEDRIDEENEINNIFGPINIDIRRNILPNLAFRSLNAEFEYKEMDNPSRIKLDLTIANNGLAESEGFNLLVSLVDTNDISKITVLKQWDSIRVDKNISAGNNLSNYTVYLDFDQYIPNGNFFFQVELDWDNNILELNENDNISFCNPLTFNLNNFGTDYAVETFVNLSEAGKELDTILELYRYTGRIDKENPFSLTSIQNDHLEFIKKNDDSKDSYAKLVARLHPGYYFARIYSYNGSMGNYNFMVYPYSYSRIGIENLDPRSPSQYEPNNVPSKSALVNLSAPFRVFKQSFPSPTDEDWVYFQVISKDDSFEIAKNTENNKGENAQRVSFSTYEGLKAKDEDWYVISVGAGKSLRSTILFEEELGELEHFIYSRRVSGGQVYFDKISDGLPIENGEVIQYNNSNSSAKDIYIQILPVTEDNGYTLNLLEVTGVPVQGAPDLMISSVVTLPLDPVEGDSLRTTVAVKNIGKVTTVSDCYIDFFLGLNEPPRPGKFGDLFEILHAGLAPQDTVYFTFEYTLPRGDHKLYASVDIEDRVDEINEINNIFGPVNLGIKGSTLPNLTFESIAADFEYNEKNNPTRIKLDFTVANNGLAESEGFNLLVSLVDTNDISKITVLKQWDSVRVEKNISAGGKLSNYTVYLDFDQYIPNGNFFFQVELDQDNNILELNENDNISFSNSLAFNLNNYGTDYVVETFLNLSKAGPEPDTILELYRYTGSIDKENPFSLSSVQNNNLDLVRKNDDSKDNYAKFMVRLRPGYYFARIYGYNGSMGNYNFMAYPYSYSRTGIEDLDPRSPSQYEPNNVPSKSALFNLGAQIKVFKQSFPSPTDEDWVYFKVLY